MENTQVALIRGINVGRAKRVAMADLRALLKDLGFGNVRTVLNSGNVVLSASASSTADTVTRIEEAIATQLGVRARVTVLTAKELEAAVADNPLAEVADNPSRLLFAVLTDPADRSRLEPLLEQDWTPERLALGPRVAYLWCPEGILASRLSPAVSRTLGDAVTSRNWATMLKLLALVEERR